MYIGYTISTILFATAQLSFLSRKKEIKKAAIKKMPFICELCDWTDMKVGKFKRHLNMHMKSQAYVCPYCNQSYCMKNTLVAHMFNIHSQTATAEELRPKAGDNTR